MKPFNPNSQRLRQLKQNALWDVIIVGSGPASASAAIVLAEKGWSVLVLEQQQKSKNRFGESLPPASVSLVRQLLGEITQTDYCRLGIKATPGNQSSWVDENLDMYDFISQPGGHGLCVNRQAFDASLQQRAIVQGSTIVKGCRFLSCAQITDKPISYQVTVQLMKDDDTTQDTAQDVTLRSQFVIDASGRHAAVAKPMGICTTRFDKLQAFVQYYHCATPSDTPDFTLLEASEHGWWYTNLLPDGQTRVVVFHTDRDLPEAKSARHQAGFNEHLSKTKHISARLKSSPHSPVGDIKSTAANSQVAEQFVKDNVLLIGDAAMAFDPLSSQGMIKAMQNGNKAAQLIAFTLEDLQAQSQDSFSQNNYLQRFEQSQQQLWQQYQQQYQYYYAAQQRFQDSEFWHRRHAAISLFEKPKRIAL
jgi:flavin-dependent dehydrogenase